MSWIMRAGRALGLGRRSAEPPWGDGFVDEGWDGLAGSVTWASVDGDELVFLIPGLSRSSPLPQQAIGRLLPFVLAAGQRAEMEARADAVGRASRAVLSWAASGLEGDAAGLRAAGLLEAALLSFETGLNGAYVFPAADPMGETLAACAWAGLVCRGRDALLPGVLAPALQDAVAAPAAASGIDDAYGQTAALLGWRLGESRLTAPLQRALRKVRDEGRSVLVPGAGAARPSSPPSGLAHALAEISLWPPGATEAGRAAREAWPR